MILGTDITDATTGEVVARRGETIVPHIVYVVEWYYGTVASVSASMDSPLDALDSLTHVVSQIRNCRGALACLKRETAYIPGWSDSETLLSCTI